MAYSLFCDGTQWYAGTHWYGAYLFVSKSIGINHALTASHYYYYYYYIVHKVQIRNI